MMSRKFKFPIFTVLTVITTAALSLAETNPSGEVVYQEGFDRGTDYWRMGKNKTHTEGETWHRNILGYYGDGVDLEWSQTGGRPGAFAYSESPWYFDDNHGQFGWLFLIASRRTGATPGEGTHEKKTQAIGKDLRNAVVRVSLRGRDIQLKGARLYFWVQGPAPPVRDKSAADQRPETATILQIRSLYQGEVFRCWAFSSQPLEGHLTDGQWHDATLKLDPDESQWSSMGLINGGLRKKIRVVQSLTSGDGTLKYVLGNGRLHNWGFLLNEVDPLDQPTGKIDFDAFSITTSPSNPPLPQP